MLLSTSGAALEMGLHAGHGGLGVGASQLELHEAVEHLEARVAPELGALRAEYPFDLVHLRSLHESGRGELPPQLAASVVQRLVQRAPGRAEALGEDIDRHAVEGERDKHLALVRRKGLGHRGAQRVEDLAALERIVHARALVDERRPALPRENDLAFLPGAPAQPDAGFEQRELIGPRSEAARAAVVVELRQHGHQRVVRCLHRDVLELLAAYVRERRPPPRELEARGPEQQRVQAADRILALRPARAQGVEHWFSDDLHRGASIRRDAHFAAAAASSSSGTSGSRSRSTGISPRDPIRALIASVTSQTFTFMPASTRPSFSQNAMNSRLSASPRSTTSSHADA